METAELTASQTPLTGHDDLAPTVQPHFEDFPKQQREDFVAVRLEGVAPSSWAATRGVYASTVVTNVRAAELHLTNKLTNSDLQDSWSVTPQSVTSPHEDVDVTIHNVGGREPDGSASTIGRWTFATKMVRDVVEDALAGDVLNACAGKTKLSHPSGLIARNDISPDRDADTHIDVTSPDLVNHYGVNSMDVIVADPPFDTGQADARYEGWHVSDLSRARDNFAQLLRPGGRYIELGWNSYGLDGRPAFVRGELHLFRRGPCHPDMFLVVDEYTQPSLSEIIE